MRRTRNPGGVCHCALYSDDAADEPAERSDRRPGHPVPDSASSEQSLAPRQSHVWQRVRSACCCGGVAIAVAWLTVEVLHGSFLGGTQESQRGPPNLHFLGAKWPFARTQQRAADFLEAEATSPQFTANLTRLVLMKEWRLMQRKSRSANAN